MPTVRLDANVLAMTVGQNVDIAIGWRVKPSSTKLDVRHRLFFKAHDSDVTDLAISKKELWTASVSDGSIKSWDLSATDV